MVKKIETFWKGLSNDRTKISALPPEQYGERFINFISDTTVSHEEAEREAQKKQGHAEGSATAVAPPTSQEKDRINGGASSSLRPSTMNVPPEPSWQPPPPPLTKAPRGSPSLLSGQKSSEIEAPMETAEHEARKTEIRGASENDIPDPVLKTTVTDAPAGSSAAAKHAFSHGNSFIAERHESMIGNQPILPVVEETTEVGSTAGRSASRTTGTSRTESDGRPLTPAKDGEEYSAGFGNPLLGYHGNLSGGGPPTPPMTAGGSGSYVKPESADSGYGVTGDAALTIVDGAGSQKSAKSRMKSQISRENLDKALPPLPKDYSMKGGA
jgi:1-phosphatidylinositol-4-phosphate 5-kinase